MSELEPEKTKRERSKAYPGAALSECVEFALRIKRGLGRGSHDRDSLAKSMGFSGVSGAVSPKIAALVHFGLLDRTGDGYELSELSKSITDPLNEVEQKSAIKAAFSRPNLYQEIVAKFEEDGQIPSQLATHLYRFHGITDSASASAAEIFLESGKYAGVLNEQNFIVSNAPTYPKNENSSAHQADTAPAEIGKTAPEPPKTLYPKLMEAEVGEPVTSARQKFEFAITRGRTVIIIAPSDLNAKDVRVIRKQVELLELQAELEAED